MSLHLSEIATGTRGFYCSWQSASQQVAAVFAALIGLLLQRWMPLQAKSDGGWRIPLIIGCLIVLLLFLLRRSLEETEASLAHLNHPNADEIHHSMIHVGVSC
ncbi:MAG: MFS transporter [Rhodanobacter sp.]